MYDLSLESNLTQSYGVLTGKARSVIIVWCVVELPTEDVPPTSWDFKCSIPLFYVKMNTEIHSEYNLGL